MTTLDYPVWLRVDHWLNVLFLTLLLRSGMEILATHPKLADVAVFLRIWANNMGCESDSQDCAKSSCSRDCTSFFEMGLPSKITVCPSAICWRMSARVLRGVLFCAMFLASMARKRSSRYRVP